MCPDTPSNQGVICPFLWWLWCSLGLPNGELSCCNVETGITWLDHHILGSEHGDFPGEQKNEGRGQKKNIKKTDLFQSLWGTNSLWGITDYHTIAMNSPVGSKRINQTTGDICYDVGVVFSWYSSIRQWMQQIEHENSYFNCNCKDLLHCILNLDIQSNPTLDSICMILKTHLTSCSDWMDVHRDVCCGLKRYVFSLSNPVIFCAISTEQRRLCVGPTMPTRVVRGEHRRYQFWSPAFKHGWLKFQNFKRDTL